jgi:Tol biopolymer transport system component
VRIPAAARIVIMLIAITAIGAACGDSGGGAAPNTPSAASPTKLASGKPSSGAGSLIIADTSGLVEYNIRSGSRKPLITPESGGSTFLLDPAISPDGKRLVYVVQPPPTIVNNCAGGQATPTVVAGGRPGAGCGTYDAGSDLWVANRDGSDPHLVFAHAQPNQLVRFPQWQDDATILAVVQEIGLQNGVTSVSYELERIPAEGGERAKLIKDVLSFGLSPDGQRLAYARLAPAGGETLNAADLSGANDQTLVDFSEHLIPFNMPRYSPDGAKIAFASADQTGARAASPEYVSAAALGPGPAPPTDGLPEDIWTVDAGGGHPVRVADLKEDLPALTWSGDGKHIYVVGSAGLYDVNIGTGAVDRLADGAFHGMLVWVP